MCCPPPTLSALLTDHPTSTALLTESLLHLTPIVRLRPTPTMSTPLPFTRPAPTSTIVVRSFRTLSSSFSPSTIFFETPSPTPTLTPSCTSLSPAHEIRLLMKVRANDGWGVCLYFLGVWWEAIFRPCLEVPHFLLTSFIHHRHCSTLLLESICKNFSYRLLFWIPFFFCLFVWARSPFGLLDVCLL